MVKVAESATRFLKGEWNHAYEYCCAAKKVFAEQCTGVAWEINSLELNGLWCLCYLGNLAQLKDEVLRKLSEGRKRGDCFSTISARSGFPNIVWLMDDDPEQARNEASESIAEWSQRAFQLQHLQDLFAQCQIDLYCSNGAKALERIESAWNKLRKSGLLKVPLNRILAAELHARVSIAAMSQGNSAVLLKAANKAKQQLAGEGRAWASGHASLVGAQLAILDGNQESR